MQYVAKRRVEAEDPVVAEAGLEEPKFCCPLDVVNGLQPKPKRAAKLNDCGLDARRKPQRHSRKKELGVPPAVLV